MSGQEGENPIEAPQDLSGDRQSVVARAETKVGNKNPKKQTPTIVSRSFETGGGGGSHPPGEKNCPGKKKNERNWGRGKRERLERPEKKQTSSVNRTTRVTKGKSRGRDPSQGSQEPIRQKKIPPKGSRSRTADRGERQLSSRAKKRGTTIGGDGSRQRTTPTPAGKEHFRNSRFE